MSLPTSLRVVRILRVLAVAACLLSLGLTQASAADALKLQERTVGEAIVPSDSGGYLVAGVTQPCSSLGLSPCRRSRLFVASFTAKGAVNTHFGKHGLATIPLGANALDLAGVAVQGDGSILIAGGGVYPSAGQLLLARFTATGQLDRSFGSGGQTALEGFTAGANHAVALDAAGRIVVAGSSPVGGVEQFAAARFLADGSVDQGFGVGGVATLRVDPDTVRERANAVVVRPDGKIVLAGGAGPDGNLSHDMETASLDVAQLLTNGEPDSGFGSGGVVELSALSVPPGPLHADLRSIALDSAGDAFIAGSISGGLKPCSQFAVGKIAPSGAPASGFANGGLALIETPGCTAASDLALAPSGQIVVAGSYASPSEVGDAGTGVLAQVASTGVSRSIYKLRLQGHSTGLDAVAVQGSKVVAAGYTASNYCLTDTRTAPCQALLVAGFEAGRPDSRFGRDGRVLDPAICASVRDGKCRRLAR
jgi:uncharacterized delta-60 repeat protein